MTTTADREGEAADLPHASDENLFFGRVPAEDRSELSSDLLTWLARAARVHLEQPRRPGETSLSLTDAPEGDVTVVEAINDDAPFLLDSTLNALTDAGLEIRLVAHPILAARRGPDGAFLSVKEAAGPGEAGETRESFIHIHVGKLAAAERETLAATLRAVYADVRAAVGDYAAMKARLTEAVATYRLSPPPLPADEIAEAVQFLQWMLADNFIFTGMRDYRFPEGEVAADPRPGTGLGVLSDPTVKVLRRGRELMVMSPEIRRFLQEPLALIITKANVLSRVHRSAYLDYVGVKLFRPDGALEGELRVVGLFAATAYTAPTRTIPYLRHKIARVLERARLDDQSHSGKALINVLESYPRDELFQIDGEALYPFAMEILQLSERPRIRVLARPDRFGRFVSVLTYLPKDRYDTEVRRKVGLCLARAFEGRVSAAYPFYPDGPLVRTHYVIGRDDETAPHVSREALEEAVAAIVRTWGDGLRQALAPGRDVAAAAAIYARYGEAFTSAYREAFGAKEALADILTIDKLTETRPRAVDFYRKTGDPAARASLKVFSRGTPLPLSVRVPLLEHLGFTVVNERTYRVRPDGQDDTVWLHDMALERQTGLPISIEELDPRIEASLMAFFRGDAESDDYDALIIEAGLGWREVAVLRALSRYARQIRVSYSQDYMAQTLVKHGAIAANLVALFRARFDPTLVGSERRDQKQAATRAEIEAALADVSVLDEDRILRRFVNLIESAVRTNFWQIGDDGQPRQTIAFKFESRKVEGMPLPAPLYEIFVASPRVEAAHLRFGKVARGGIRWSDRPEDFRTEILGLVKAQQVKNAVIVPVGAKGGFIPKKLPAQTDRAAWLAEGTEAYRIFIRTLLELTDNLDGARVIPAPQTVRHDGDDPYLVVAADKGTATFSDTANALSEEKHHWLGDAFASGGSVGYDHKKMGITAKGAWEAVKRHFRETGVDIQVTPFSVAGVGDMSGDVFGNGMLLSPAIRLVAAFDHRDIFLDPDPDIAATFAERQRMFALPRSSWQDFDTSLISAGGGVFSRGLKSVPLSAPVRAMLGFEAAQATPQEIMNAILRMKVDLLWFGGIGTYIRAADETDAEAGDRANDAVRITGAEVGATVIGEGANLGVTQRGRIEAARSGVRLNTDAIDNSAGVNCSDVEVNIKIALATPERDGRLSGPDRVALLSEMTNDVSRLVLRNNYLQTLAISLAERRGAADVGYLRRFMERLEAEGRLDRKVESLPDATALATREQAGQGLTRPELAVLLAYAKLTFYDDLLASDAPDDPYFHAELRQYFPPAIKARFPDAIDTHRLRREIVATGLANAIVNHAGPGVVRRLVDRTGCGVGAVARAYAAARDCFGLVELNAALDAMDGKLDGRRQLALYASLQELLVSRMAWFVRNLPAGADLAKTVTHFRAGVEDVAAGLGLDMTPLAAELIGLGMPEAAAKRLATIDRLVDAPDVVRLADASKKPLGAVADAYYALENTLSLGELRHAAESVAAGDYYERLALERAVDGLGAAHATLATDALSDGVEGWSRRRAPELDRTKASIAELSRGGFSVAKLSVAAGLLGDLAR